MSPDDLRRLLQQVQSGDVSVTEALHSVRDEATADLGFAQVDLARKGRCGFPEVIFGEGKTPQWIEEVVRRLGTAGQNCLATRVSEEQSRHLVKHFPAAEQDRTARTFWLPTASNRQERRGAVLVVTAGTSDLPVAQEACVTARAVGANVDLLADVGVAGIHRLLRHRDRLRTADAIVVAAGMDGALPSVVGGLVDCPVIAVPTSVGYGAAFHGVAPLLTMLNACAANVVVVNIDAGFKAGYVAALIARRSTRSSAPMAQNNETKNESQ
jgi:NCAIR mutase (PurE)-related protein